MIQLQILSGKQAGNRWIARRFPVRVGRDAGNDLKLEEDGVWDRHCEVAFDRKKGFVLTAQPKALLTVNSEPMAEPYVLRNGDSLTVGSVHLRFWLGDPKPRSSRVREALVWTLIAAICLSQIALVYWLVK